MLAGANETPQRGVFPDLAPNMGSLHCFYQPRYALASPTCGQVCFLALQAGIPAQEGGAQEQLGW